mmetsp:Transcript_5866/g.13914  ORF Transcript_5866/g.13914 Transcript_5866/m.13914 type:complete len:210 (-) Transcript_5866:29-658(-)
MTRRATSTQSVTPVHSTRYPKGVGVTSSFFPRSIRHLLLGIAQSLPSLESNLLVDPRSFAAFPFADSLGEPVGNFLVGGFDRVRSVADVAANLNAEVSTDGSHGGVRGHGGTKHFASFNAGSLSFPDHSTDWSRGHVSNKSREELLCLKVFVVGFHVFLGTLGELHGNKLESLLFKALDDFSDKSTLDAIRLDHDVSSLHFCSLIIETK